MNAFSIACVIVATSNKHQSNVLEVLTRYIKGHRPRLIAHALGIPIKTIYNILYRYRHDLKHYKTLNKED